MGRRLDRTRGRNGGGRLLAQDGGREPRLARAMTVGLAALALFVAGCLCPSHPPDALARAGFRSPRQTFETFFAAFDYQLFGLEFRCFSAEFRRRNRVSEITWREFRDQLEREHPLLRLAARVEWVEEHAEGPRTHWIVAKAAGRTVRLRFVREDFYEFWAGDVLAADGSWSQGEPWKVDEGASAASVRLPLDADQAATLNAASISEIRVGYEWKLDDLVEEPAPRP